MTTNKKQRSKTSPNHLLSFSDEQKFLHEPLRLQIISYLYAVQSADMKFLQKQLTVSWGNISFHSNKLEERGYIEITKKFIEKKPYTIFKITETGKKAFENYKKTLKNIF